MWRQASGSDNTENECDNLSAKANNCDDRINVITVRMLWQCTEYDDNTSCSDDTDNMVTVAVSVTTLWVSMGESTRGDNWSYCKSKCDDR